MGELNTAAQKSMKEETQVDAQLTAATARICEIEGKLDRADEILMALYNRLKKVLPEGHELPSVSTPSQPQAPAPTALVPLAVSMRERNERLDRIKDGITEHADRLQNMMQLIEL